MAEFKFHQLPSALILVDGKLLLKDGGDPQEILREFQKNAGIPDGGVVNIMPRHIAQRNWEAEQKQRIWGYTYSIASKEIMEERPVRIEGDPEGFEIVFSSEDFSCKECCLSKTIHLNKCLDAPCSSDLREDGRSVHYIQLSPKTKI